MVFISQHSIPYSYPQWNTIHGDLHPRLFLCKMGLNYSSNRSKMKLDRFHGHYRSGLLQILGPKRTTLINYNDSHSSYKLNSVQYIRTYNNWCPIFLVILTIVPYWRSSIKWEKVSGYTVEKCGHSRLISRPIYKLVNIHGWSISVLTW